MRHGARERLRSKSGFVLLITLLIILLLSVIIFEIDFQARADLRAAVNFRDDLTAYYLARSGISLGKDVLREDMENANEPWDTASDLWATPVPPIPLGEGTVSGAIKDESAKINLNFLVGPNDNIILWRKEQLQRLFRLIEIAPGLVDPMIDSIIDWIDKNDATGPSGAESEYAFLDPPYAAKNGPIETLEELHFIKGITPDIYQKITPYLTIHTEGKLNINTADSTILQSLHNYITEEIAKELMSSRPYVSAETFKVNLGAGIKNTMDIGMGNSFDIRSHIFSMEAMGTVGNTKKILRAVWNRQQNKLLYFEVQ